MIFFKLLIEIFIGNNELNKIVRYNLFNQHCFSLPDSANFDRLIGLRQFKRVLYKLWVEKIEVADLHCTGNFNSSTFLYVLFPENIPDKLNYLNGKSKIDGAISKMNLLLELSFFHKIVFTIISFVLGPFVVFYTLFFKKYRTMGWTIKFKFWFWFKF